MRQTCYQQRADGLLLFFRLTPNARKDEVLGLVDGTDGPVIGVKVRAIPDKGKANKALVALASDWLDLTKSAVFLKSGSKSRLKTLMIEGEPVELVSTLRLALKRCDKEMEPS